MSVQRVVISIMLLAFSTVYLGTMALGNHPMSEIMVTVNAFASIIIAVNLEHLVSISRALPAPAMCVWLGFFLLQVYIVYYISMNEDTDKTAVTRIWFIMDVIFCILTFCVVLTHCVLIFTGSGGSTTQDADSDFVAIRVGSNRRSRGLGRNLPMPTASKSAKASRPKGRLSSLPSGLAF